VIPVWQVCSKDHIITSKGLVATMTWLTVME